MLDDWNTTVGELRQAVSQFVAGRQWEQFHTPKNLCASIAIEAGELLECLQWIDDVDDAARLEAELADVVIYCLALTNALALDIAAFHPHAV